MFQHSSVLCAAAVGSFAVFLAAAPYPEAGRAVVAADHVLASEAGRDVLRKGGNAADAAVAAALSAGVVQPAGSGLGGGGFAVGAGFGDAPFSLDFREVAPSRATVDMFRTADGGAEPLKSREGGAAVAVPMEGIGLARLVEERGALTRKAVAQPALAQATRGFPVGPHLAKALRRTTHKQVLGLLSVGGVPARAGDWLQRPGLARAIRAWIRHGEDAYQRGDVAQAIVDASVASGGILTFDDLAEAEPIQRKPLVGSYRGHTVITMAPPSSGGIALLQMLAVLERHDVAALGHNSSAYMHRLAETMKHVYADRAHHLGDPQFVDVPVDRLLSAERISEIDNAFDAAQTFDAATYGPLLAPPVDAGTQHISVVDEEGRAIALTTTINTSFGSGLVVPAYDLILNNEMDDFSAQPGVPNAFGLVGGAANAIAPGKRPLSSMTPTVVLGQDGNVVLVVGASGGSTIISATLQVLLGVLDFGLNPQEAVAAGRMHHQWLPDVLLLEPDVPQDVASALEARGHRLRRMRGFSAVQVVQAGEQVVGGSDPRKGGWPAAVRRSSH